MAKYEVGKAIWLTRDNHLDYEPTRIWGEFAAYCKGKNGHYYLVMNTWDVRIMRLQRITQYDDTDRIRLSVADVDYFYGLKEQTPEALQKFQDIVMAHKPYRAKVIKDVQRRRCYTWEAQFGNRSDIKCKFLNKDQAIALTSKIANEAEVKLPKIKFGTVGTSWAKGSWEVKYCAPNGVVSDKTVIHEMAHIIDAARNLKRTQGHGAAFIGIYIKLLEKYMGYDVKYLEEVAKEFKLKIEY